MRATLKLELRDRDGLLVVMRRARNSVMRDGAVLVARLFSGGGDPISHMGVGTSGDPESPDFVTASLTNEPFGDLPALTGDTEVQLPDGTFTDPIVDDSRRVARVRFHATLPSSAAVGTVREAGLIARNGDQAVLYNRVIFAPFTKGDDHELTLFWEVAFPYGDLQWLE